MTFPAHWEADVVLADGGTVHLRPIGPHDADRLRAMHARLSPDTIYLRFFSMVRNLTPRDVQRLTDVDHDDRVAIIALLRDEMVAVARYTRLADGVTAEVAVVVEDAHQGRGLGPVLLEHLAAAAEERGVERFTASVLPSNRRMIEVFRSAGFELERHLADGLVELSYPIHRTERTVTVSRAREHQAEARSVARLLAPRTVAVIGASREPGTAGHEVFVSLLRAGFQGPVYPVNPVASHVASVPAFADVRDVPDEVDLAVVAVPAEHVLDAVRACVDKRVHGLVVVSGGFADAGEEGRKRLAEVVRAARDGGLRLIGPNAMGIVNTDPSVRLHATFAKGRATPGRVGVFSQSGALAGTVLAEAERRMLGLSSFVSIGDRADVSGNDVLQYWLEDEHTEVVALHLQGFGNPRKFGRIAREVGRTKPVVALKSGRGARDVAVDALFRSAGVIRVDTLAQLFETAQLLATQPLPSGRRVGIVGTSSALAALAVDACRSVGLDVVTLSAGLREELRTDGANPVDLGPLATAEQLGAALRAVGGSGEVDALLVLVTPNADEDGMAAMLRSLEVDVPVLASYLGHDGVPPTLAVPHLSPEPAVAEGSGAPPDGGSRRQVVGEAAGRGSIPSYASPESAAAALARAVAYAEWRATPIGGVPPLEPDHELARAVVAAAPHDGTALDDPWVLLKAYGITPATAVPGGSQALSLRLRHDPAVGPLVSLRLGGEVARLLADPVTRATPLTDLEADHMVREMRGSSLLAGTDTHALEDLLHRVARLGEDLPEVHEVVLEPVDVHPGGVAVGDAVVRLLPPEPDPERLARQVVGDSAAQLR